MRQISRQKIRLLHHASRFVVLMLLSKVALPFLFSQLSRTPCHRTPSTLVATHQAVVRVSPCIRHQHTSTILKQSNIEIFQDFDSYPNEESSTNNDEFSKSLSDRIAAVKEAQSNFVRGLQKRVDTLAKAEELEVTMLSGVVDLPVICFDALLPGQRLSGSTTDPTFCDILRSLGLGGSFVMTSINTKQRRLRRYATVARIELVDVEPDTEFSPTAVSFMIVGKRCCEILGCAKGMKTRVGRWRRDYDPDGEEARLGWGYESFVDVEEERLDDNLALLSNGEDKCTSKNEWNANTIRIIDVDAEDINATNTAIVKATSIVPLLEEWYSLASNQAIYNNIYITAATRIARGQPGLRVNAAKLLAKVRSELGPMPPPSKPTALATWGAALINPVPALGVSPEIRGAVMHVQGADAKLAVLERGIVRSLCNLNGTMPL